MIVLYFTRPLGDLSKPERDAVADVLAGIACEILKGEHDRCVGVHAIPYPGEGIQEAVYEP